MELPQITILYAGLLGILAVALGASAGARRAKTGISLGDGGDRELLLRMRRHANFVEYVPLALILVALLEMLGVTASAIHLLGGLLVLGRFLHALGFSENVRSVPRGLGTGLSVLVIAVASIWGIVTYLQSAI